MKSKLLFAIIVLLLQISISIRAEDNGAYKSQDLKNVEKLYRSCLSTAKALIGGPVVGAAENLLLTYANIGKNLQSFCTSSSATVSSATIALVEVTDIFANINGSPSNFLKKLNAVLGRTMSIFRDIVSELTGDVAEISTSVNEAIFNLEISLRNVIETTLNAGVFKIGLSRKLAFDAISNDVQVLVNTVAVITETNVSSPYINLDDEIVALTLLLQVVLMIVQGINILIGSSLSQTFQTIPLGLEVLLTHVGNTVDGLGSAICSLASNITYSVTAVVGELSSTVLNLSVNLNESLQSVFGVVDGIIGNLL